MLLAISPETALRILKPWMPDAQWRTVRDFVSARDSFFSDKVVALAQQIEAMPSTGESPSGGKAIAHLHYFKGGMDVWVLEKDAGAPDDEPAQEQSQMYGLSAQHRGETRYGYLCRAHIVGAGAELDLHWQPVSVAELKKQRGEE